MARKGEVNHYATGITLITVGVFGIIGSITGELANMLAALWAPDTLADASGATQVSKSTAAKAVSAWAWLQNPTNWLNISIVKGLGI